MPSFVAWRVAFEEIPQRELRVYLTHFGSCSAGTFSCIRRNPTKGIESDVVLQDPVSAYVVGCIRRNPTKGIESTVYLPPSEIDPCRVVQLHSKKSHKGNWEGKGSASVVCSSVLPALHSKKSHKGNWERNGYIAPHPHIILSSLHSKKSHKGNWEMTWILWGW